MVGDHCDDGMHGDRDRVWSAIIVMTVCMVIETELNAGLVYITRDKLSNSCRSNYGHVCRGTRY